MPPLNPVLASHVIQTIKDIGIQVGHAQDVGGPARTGYYKAALLLTASLVEAVLYDLIEYKYRATPSLLDGVRTFKNSRAISTLHQLPNSIVVPGKELWICEVDRTRIDRKTSFAELNKLALETGIIGQRLSRKIDRVRIKRNEIHLQIMSSTSRRYDLRTVEYTSAVLLELFNLY
jgi:hypothetical protein